MYVIIEYFFLFFFDEEYLYVLNILPFQLIIVYLRTISGIQFTIDLVSEAYTRNIAVQYFFLTLVVIYINLNYKSLDVLLFIKVITLMSLLTNITNFLFRWLKK